MPSSLHDSPLVMYPSSGLYFHTSLLARIQETCFWNMNLVSILLIQLANIRFRKVQNYSTVQRQTKFQTFKNVHGIGFVAIAQHLKQHNSNKKPRATNPIYLDEGCECK
ncbi:hypothetical protein Droror1_Dr00005106 [Drosera rotundifolia]